MMTVSFFVAMILTYEERSFVWVAIVLAAELCLDISVLGSSSGKTYELWNVISINCWCWNIATDELKVWTNF